MKNLHDADLLSRQASNALLIAASRAAMARCRRAVRISDQLMRASARLIPRSSLHAPPWQTPSEGDQQAEGDEVARRQAHGERRAVEVLQQIGISLRSSAEEIVVKSRETRWQARQIRMQSGALRSRLRQAY